MATFQMSLFLNQMLRKENSLRQTRQSFQSRAASKARKDFLGNSRKESPQLIKLVPGTAAFSMSAAAFNSQLG
jgi:hypothetical protein